MEHSKTSPRTDDVYDKIKVIDEVINKRISSYTNLLTKIKKKSYNNNITAIKQAKEILLHYKRDITKFKLFKNHMEILLYETKLKEKNDEIEYYEDPDFAKDLGGKNVILFQRKNILDNLNNLKQNKMALLGDYKRYLQKYYKNDYKEYKFKEFKIDVEREIRNALNDIVPNYSIKSASRNHSLSRKHNSFKPRSSSKKMSNTMNTKSFSRTTRVPSNTAAQTVIDYCENHTFNDDCYKYYNNLYNYSLNTIKHSNNEREINEAKEALKQSIMGLNDGITEGDIDIDKIVDQIKGINNYIPGKVNSSPPSLFQTAKERLNGTRRSRFKIREKLGFNRKIRNPKIKTRKPRKPKQTKKKRKNNNK